MKTPTRKEIMESNDVHDLTKDILRMSEDKDIVDRYYDVLLAVRILKAEMDDALEKAIKNIIGEEPLA